MQNRKKRHRCTEQTFVSVGEGEGGIFKENSIETCILSRVKHHQPRLDAWDKCSGLVHWEDPGRLGGREVGGGMGMGNTCKSMADSCQCMAKTT